MSEFKIGDKVRIVGPSTATFEFIGTEFIINQIRPVGFGKIVYRTSEEINGVLMPWYSASSLVLVGEGKTLVDRIEVIEQKIELISEWMDLQTIINNNVNKVLLIVDENLENCKRPDGRAEGLKVGDWVVVIGAPTGVGPKDVGLTTKVEKALQDYDGKMVYYINGWWYSASSLRFLSDDEISRRLNA